MASFDRPIICKLFQEKLSTLLTARYLPKPLLAVLFALLISGPSLADQKWRLATFNCEFLSRKMVHIKYGLPFELTDEQRAQWSGPFREAKFLEASKAVAKVIVSLDAEVIGLTEVGNEQDIETLMAALRAEGLDYPYHRVCKSIDTYTGQHVALLSKRPILDFWEQIPGQEFYTPEPDDPEVERSAQVTKGLYAKVGDETLALNLFLVHLRSERGGHGSDEERAAQASIVRRHSLKPLQAGEHVVIMGDLNDRRGQPALMRIRGRHDIFEDLVQTGLPKYFPRNKHGTRWTYSYLGERQQIDHILISRSLEESAHPNGVRPSVHPVLERLGDSEHKASDHRALVLELHFR